VDNKTGENVLGLKPGLSAYKSNEGIVKVKAAAVAQAMYNAAIPLSIANLYFYGQLKAHDVGELVTLMKQYPPGSSLPGNLIGDGSSQKSTYCEWAAKLPSQEEVCSGAALVGQQLPGCPALPGTSAGAGAGAGAGGGGFTYRPPILRLDPNFQAQLDKNNKTDEEESGLSTGVMIGIGVAVVAAAVLLTRK